MTKLLTALFNALIKEGYSFDFIDERKRSILYSLVNERTNCDIAVTEKRIYISLCLREELEKDVYDYERNLVVECAEDLPAAEELIHSYEDWHDEAVRCAKVKTYYVVMVTHHSYYDEVNGEAGYKEPAGIFATPRDAEEFIHSAPGYDDKEDCELYYDIQSVKINTEE